MTTRARAWTSSPVAVVTVAAVTMGVAYSLWPRVATELGFPPSGHQVGLVSIVLETAAAVTAAAAVLWAARRQSPGHRRAWTLFGVGLALWSLGSVVWAGYLVADVDVPNPGPPDLLYLMLVPAVAAGAALFPSRKGRALGFRVVVDGLLISASLLLILSVAVFGAAVRDLDTSPAAFLVNLSYPLADTALIVLLIGLLGRVGSARRTPLAMLAVGLGFIAVADLLVVVLGAYDAYDDSPLITDVGWSVGFVVIAGAGLLAGRRVGAQEAEDEDHRRYPALVVTPIVLAVVALVVGLLDISLRRTEVPWSAPLAVLVVSLLLARQALTLADNRRLAADLAARVRDLSYQATHDRLTGLNNRSELVERVAASMGRSAATGRVAAAVFVDVDHLKTVNDSLGHDRGDVLIATIAERLRAAAGDDVTRFGGDEFVVVLEGCRSRTEAIQATADLVARGCELLDLDGLTLRPSISAGVALAEPGMTPEELLRRADVALYRAKANGRQRAVVYETSMDTGTRRRIELEPELRRALERHEFEVHYQPVFELGTRRLTGAEALLRWRHPDRGLLLPADFLDEAEACGLLAAIGERTLRVATARFAELNARPGQPPLQVAVNLSTSELATGDATARVSAALAASGLDPSRLVLEITEDVVVDATTRRTIDGLCALGTGIAIDDFGAGNSSLRQLGTYPADVLKVDRTFVDGLGTEPEDTFIVRAILNLARNLGLRTVAEGIETPAQEGLLADLGCDAGQGWLFGRAVPFPEFERLHLRRPAVVGTPPPETL